MDSTPFDGFSNGQSSDTNELREDLAEIRLGVLGVSGGAESAGVPGGIVESLERG